MSKLLTSSEAAESLRIQQQTLASWRTKKRYNLPYQKVGSKVMYWEDDIRAFLERNYVNCSMVDP